MKTIRIGRKEIGEGKPCFVIAEAGVNHNGKVSIAKKLVDAAVQARADAVKFQSFKTEELVEKGTAKPAYQSKALGKKISQDEMIKSLELKEKDFRELLGYCKRKGIIFLSTPFDFESADMLEKIGVSAFKIGSGEITNHPLIEHIAAKKKPVLLSTGMAFMSEVAEAVELVKKINQKLVLMQCTSSYPAKTENANLLVLHEYMKRFNCIVGYSDHTLGINSALAAVALGAKVVEKHITIDRAMRGPDHKASTEPNEMRKLVDAIREVEASLGVKEKKPIGKEMELRKLARKSIFARIKINKGERISKRMLKIVRPAEGIQPKFFSRVIGSIAARNIPTGKPVKKIDLSGFYE